MRRLLWLVLATWCLAAPLAATAATPVRVEVPIRGKTLALMIYRPAGTPRGTIIMGSGDVGWVGLAVSRSQDLSADGYIAVGVNVREYLSTFTSGAAHLSASDIQHDFAEMARTELLVIDAGTTVRRFHDELRWNQAYFRLAQGI